MWMHMIVLYENMNVKIHEYIMKTYEYMSISWETYEYIMKMHEYMMKTNE